MSADDYTISQQQRTSGTVFAASDADASALIFFSSSSLLYIEAEQVQMGSMSVLS